MQTSQSIRSTQAMPSQASQLPQVTGPGFQDQVGYTAASLRLLILICPVGEAVRQGRKRLVTWRFFQVTRCGSNSRCYRGNGYVPGQ